MVKLVVQTPEGVEIRQDLAGVGSRAAAAFVDGLFFLVVVAGLGLLIAIAASVRGGGAETFLLGVYLGGILLLGLAYPFVFHVAQDGQTPGKKMVGIRVVSADGSPASTVQHLIRSLLLLADLLPVPIPLGFWLIAISPEHARLGDLAAGTIVLRVGDEARAPEPRPTDRWSTLIDRRLPLEPHAARTLSPRDVAFLRDMVTRSSLEPNASAKIFDAVAQTYCTKLGIENPPMVGSTEVVRELYLYAREFATVSAAGSASGPASESASFAG